MHQFLLYWWIDDDGDDENVDRHDLDDDEYEDFTDKGSRPLPNRMFFYTLCKRPLTPPSPSILHNHVVDFST